MSIFFFFFFFIFSLFWLSTSKEYNPKDFKGDAILTIAFGRTYFTTLGAVVAVDPVTANYTILGTFDWPSNVKNTACELMDPIITVDRDNYHIYLNFGSQFGSMATLAPFKLEVIETGASDDPFFVGFTNMRSNLQKPIGKILGTSPVGNNHGEYSFGKLTLPYEKTFHYDNMSLIPYRGVMDDTAHLDVSKSDGNFYVQVSYPKETKYACAPDDFDLCMLPIDSKTGQFGKAVFTNWTGYHYFDDQVYDTTGSVDSLYAWIEGFPSKCNHPYNDFLFAEVNLLTGAAKPAACLDHSVTIQEDEWIAAFNLDGTIFVTASRWSDTTQFLSLDTKTGKAIQNSPLDGIAKDLEAKMGLFYVWSVNFF